MIVSGCFCHSGRLGATISQKQLCTKNELSISFNALLINTQEFDGGFACRADASRTGPWGRKLMGTPHLMSPGPNVDSLQ